LNKLVTLAVFGYLSFAVTLAPAQEQQKKSGADLSAWVNSLQKKLDQIVPRKSVPLRSGVGWGSGSKVDTQVKLYWKGNKDDDAVTEEELTKFKSAVNAAARDDRAGAIKGLEDYMKQYPDSALIPDAKKTLDLVKSEAMEGKQ
jgi:TolA-binding protein